MREYYKLLIIEVMYKYVSFGKVKKICLRFENEIVKGIGS